MKTSEAKKLIQDMTNQGKLKYDSSKGLLLTEKAAGVSLESLAELTAEQVSRIGQEYDSLFETRKRVQNLTKNGVDVNTLRNLLAEIGRNDPNTCELCGLYPKLNGFPQCADCKRRNEEGKETDAEDNQGQLLLPGEETESGTSGTDSLEGHSTGETETPSGESGATPDIHESDDGNTGRQSPGRSRQRRGASE